MTVENIMKLADEFANDQASFCLENLYGSSKSYTEEKLRESIASRSVLLAAVEELAMDAAKAKHVVTTMQPIIQDQNGVVRFKRNGLVDALYEHGVKTGLGLNELHQMDFTDEDRQQFAQLIGYSVSGYADLSYVTDEAYEALDAAMKGQS